MIPIKILCSCGQKYAFETEPTQGGIACAVQCPVCGADGTAAADLAIAEYLNGAPLSSSNLRVRASGAPAPAAPVKAPYPPTPPVSFNPPARKSKTKWIALSACGAAVLSLVIVLVVTRSHSSERLEKSGSPSARIDAENKSTELDAFYPEPPSGQNAATLFLEAFDSMQLGQSKNANLPLLGKGKLPPVGAALPSATKAAIAALVEENRRGLELMGQALKMNQSRYPINLTLGYDLILPHLPKMRSAGMIVQLAAALHADDQQGREAANDILKAFGLIRSVQAEATLISQMFRSSGMWWGVSALERSVNRVVLPPDALAQLLTTLRQMEEVESKGEGFDHAFLVERMNGLGILEHPQEFLAKLKNPGPGMAVPPRESTQWQSCLQDGKEVRAAREFYDETIRQILAARKQPFPGKLEIEALIRERAGEAADKHIGIIALMIPAMANIPAKEAAGLAQLRLALTAVALETFRTTHANSYPGSLAQLTPSILSTVPLDPFDGQPLRFVKRGSGYLLYSIGPDLFDNGGQPMRGKSGDILFTVNAAKGSE